LIHGTQVWKTSGAIRLSHSNTEILNLHNNRRQTRGSEMVEYYCNSCGTQIEQTDMVCPKCGKNLSEVGKRMKVTITETIGLSDSVERQLTKEQSSIIKRILRAIKRYLAKKELTFSIYPDGHISFTIRDKEKT
jgi:uncharacterized Zn finger protein (UPF0148 family)